MRHPLWKASEGSIAVLSLWVITILAFLAAGLAQSVQQKTAVFEHLHSREEARALEESVAKKAIAGIQESPLTLGLTATGKEWYYDPSAKTQTLDLNGGHVTLRIEDENAKINLNEADFSVLADLFAAVAHADSDQANRLAGATVDFRDKDDYVTGEGSGGSEKGTYQQAGLTYGPKNGDFESIEELLLVKGVTKEIYSLVENYITIYGNGRVNVNTCQKETLLALGLTETLAEKIMAFRSGRHPKKGGVSDARLFKDLARIGSDLSGLEPLSDEDRESLIHALRHNDLSVTSDHFKLKGLARTLEGRFSSTFVCVYGSRDGVKYWAES